MPRTTLSITIPNYNHGHFLRPCLEAYLGQTRLPDEILIVDDGSTDESARILQEYAARHDRVRVLYNDRNRGIGYTVNRLLGEARGDYVYTAAVDDLPGPRLCENMLALAEAHPQAAVVTTNFRFQIVSADGHSQPHDSEIRLAPGPSYLAPAELERALRAAKVPFVGLGMFRREDLLQTGFHEEFGWYLDQMQCLLFGFRTGLCYSPDPQVDFLITAESYSGQGRRNRSADRDLLANIVRALRTPPWADVAPNLLRSRVLSHHGADLILAVLQRPDCWWFLPWALEPRTLRIAFWKESARALYPLVPTWLRTRYRQLKLWLRERLEQARQGFL